MDNKAVTYIKKRFSEGIPESQIIEELKNAGWKIPDINLALAEAQGIFRAQKLIAPSILIKNSWNEYRLNWKLYISIVLLPAFVQAVPALFMSLFTKLNEEEFLKAQIAENPFPILIFFGIYILSLVIVSTLSFVALLSAIMKKNEAQTVQGAYALAAKFFWNYLWLIILNTFIVTGAYFFFIVPGVLYQIWFSFALYILIDQNIRGTQALLMSKEYVKNHFGEIFARFFIVIVFTFALSFAFSSVSTAVELSTKYFFPQFKGALLAIIQAGEIFGMYIVMPFWALYTYHLYADLKKIKGEISLLKKSQIIKPMLFSLAGWMALILMIGFIIFQLWQTGGKQIFSKNIDLFIIQTPLSAYSIKNNSYPKNLRELAPAYIEELPKTFEDEKNYSYTVSEDKKNYKLCILEDSREIECVTKE